MRRDQRVPGEREAGAAAASVVAAARIVVERWGLPWMHRRVGGEKLGVWVLGMIWIAIPAVLGLVLFW